MSKAEEQKLNNEQINNPEEENNIEDGVENNLSNEELFESIDSEVESVKNRVNNDFEQTDDPEIKKELKSLNENIEKESEKVKHEVRGNDLEGKEENKVSKVSEILDELGMEELPSTKDFYEAYNYHPDTIERIDIKELGFEITQEIENKVVEAADSILDKDCQPTISEDNVLGVFPKKTEPAEVLIELGDSNEIYVFRNEIHDLGEHSGHNAFCISIKEIAEDNEKDNRFTDKQIADFHLYMDEDSTWELGHRLVKGNYRGQALGTTMLNMQEKCIQSFADRENEEQIINIGARQVDVVKFAIKNGYELASEEDEKNFKRLMRQDKEDMILTTAIGWQQDDGKSKQGYIYEKSIIDDLIESYNEDEFVENRIKYEDNCDLDQVFYHDPSEYMYRATTINFQKKFKPKNNE